MAAFEWRHPPDGMVRVDEVEGRLELSWQPPHVRGRRNLVLFLISLLVGWTLFEAGFIYALVSSPRGLEIIPLAWIGIWTCAGVMVSRALWRQIRRPDLERIVLDGRTFTHHPAYRPPTLTRERGLVLTFPQPWPTQALHRAALSTLRLDRIRQRITYQASDVRVEIGECLREPEREWLARLLADWRSTELDQTVD